jgi:heptosyltransferase III
VEILILHPGALGDIILSFPAIALLRKHHPGAQISLAANTDYLAPLARGYADRFLSLAALPLYVLYSPEPPAGNQADFWKSYARIVSWTGHGDPDFVRNLRQIHPDARIASWRPGPSEKEHVSRLFINTLGPELASKPGVAPARIHLSPAVYERGIRWFADCGLLGGEPVVAIHPGAGSKGKRWPADRFINLARHLVIDKGQKLLIIEGPAEPGLAIQIQRALPPAKSILAESLPLELLAGVLEKCTAFVGNDSGIAHLAAGLAVPSIVLFGPTLPAHWAPLGNNVMVLHKPSGCLACASGGGEHLCLDNISVEDVIKSFENLALHAPPAQS